MKHRSLGLDGPSAKDQQSDLKQRIHIAPQLNACLFTNSYTSVSQVDIN